ncbi:MAG: extracellular solute-binding protein [Proteobacteria bacterium]|nr:extracellular solute-binding protein [Pseudomonadota bacterium]
MSLRLLLLLLLMVGWPAMAQEEPTEIVLWHSYRGDEQAGLEQAARQWGEAQGVRVRTLALPFGAFDSKVETAIPRGNGPDVFVAAHGSLGKWATMGIVVPTELNADDYRPATLKAAQWEGQQYGIPLAFKSLMLLYDPTVVKEVPRTTDELIAAAKKFTGNGRYGLAYQAAEPFFHGSWMHAFGAETVGDGPIQLNSPEHVAAFRFSRRIAVDEGIVPAQPTAELVTRLYEEQNAVFVISGPWFVAEVEREVAGATLPIVSETGQPAQPFLTVDVAFLADQSKHPKLAGSLGLWLAEEEGARIRQDVGGQAVSWNGLDPTDPLLRVLTEQAKNAVPLPADPRLGSVFEAQARALRQLMRGAVGPDEAAFNAQLTFDVLNRPPPDPVSPWPYVAIIAIAALIVLSWLGAPLLQPSERQRVWSHRWDYIWVVPAGVAMTLLVVVPFATGAGVSLFAHHQGEWTFVGIRHFIDILFARDWPVTSPLSFVFTLGVTLLWTVSNLILHVSIGIALAMILREPWIRLRGLWRALLIIPWAVPNYITALIWKGMFHAQYGAINALLGLVALKDQPIEIDWFGGFVTSFSANLATNTWLGFPFMMVVTLGALQSIPRDLEEAAEMDGAGAWFRFRHVIWPLLKPALLPAVILGSVWTFNMFNVIYLVSAGEPDSSTEILISEAYRWAFSRGNRYGYASAYAVLIFGVLLIYSRGANRLVGRKVL